MTEQNRKHALNAGQYATAADFKQIFTEDVNSLYLLSVLLTGSPEKAEECFVEGIGESTKGNRVFKEWARSWARRTIIQSAIRVIGPRERSVTAIRNAHLERVMEKVPMVLHAEVCAILELAPFERFVFVMSVLERYSDNDCSILLGCARRDIVTARAHAMQQLVTLLGLQRNSAVDAIPPAATELVIAQHFATSVWTKSLSQ
jgi:DNA-directed RNA polymerase specialized sigma24 family protein